MVIGGVPAYGDPDLMDKLLPQHERERLTVCGAPKKLYIKPQQGIPETAKTFKQISGELQSKLSEWDTSLAELAPARALIGTNMLCGDLRFAPSIVSRKHLYRFDPRRPPAGLTEIDDQESGLQTSLRVIRPMHSSSFAVASFSGLLGGPKPNWPSLRSLVFSALSRIPPLVDQLTVKLVVLQAVPPLVVTAIRPPCPRTAGALYEPTPQLGLVNLHVVVDRPR